MIQKQVFKIIPIFLLLTFSNCTESILEVENKNELTSENWYRTKSDFLLALNSCYEPLASRGTFKLNFSLLLESFSDRVLHESMIYDKLEIETTNQIINQTWIDLYTGVYRTSKLIKIAYEKGVGSIQEMDSVTFKNYIAQTKALRGVYYFYLVVLFNEPIFYNESNIPKDLMQSFTNTSQKVFWEQIEKDFTESIDFLKNKSELLESEMGKVTKSGAKAMLAKALLYKHYHFYCRNSNKGSAGDVADLNKAKQLLEEIMNSGQYSLVEVQEPKTKDDYVYALLSNSAFIDLVTSGGNVYPSENNEESVWEVQFTEETEFYGSWLPNPWNSPGEWSFQYFSPHQESYKVHEVNPSFFQQFELAGFNTDPRLEATCYFDGDTMDFRIESPYYKKFNAITDIKRIAKSRNLKLPSEAPLGLGFRKHFFPIYYMNLYAPWHSPSNKRMIRYADVLLYYAEIEFLLGNTSGFGLDALNTVRRRVDIPTVHSLSVEVIKHERDIEMAYEWSRYLDLIRWSFDPDWNINWEEINWGIDKDNSVIPFKKGKNEYFPIPQYEIDLNAKSLKQNPGW